MVCLTPYSVCLAGKYTWSNSAVYEGEYEDNMKQGQGTMTFPDKSKYEGGRHADCMPAVGAAWHDASALSCSPAVGRPHRACASVVTC
jgi:hypothetical protein